MVAVAYDLQLILPTMVIAVTLLQIIVMKRAKVRYNVMVAVVHLNLLIVRHVVVPQMLVFLVVLLQTTVERPIWVRLIVLERVEQQYLLIAIRVL